MQTFDLAWLQGMAAFFDKTQRVVNQGSRTLDATHDRRFVEIASALETEQCTGHIFVPTAWAFAHL